MAGDGDHFAGGGVLPVGEPGGDELVDETGDHDEEDQTDEHDEEPPDPEPQPPARGSGSWPVCPGHHDASSFQIANDASSETVFLTPRYRSLGGRGREALAPLREPIIAYRLPASAAHTARPSARLSAPKASGSPTLGVICAFMDTVAERLPLGLEAMNWV